MRLALALLALAACGHAASTPPPIASSAAAPPPPASPPVTSTALRELVRWDDVRCASARCTRSVAVSVGDFASFGPDPYAQAGLGVELSRHADELAPCYLAAFAGSDTAAWVVLPITLGVATSPAAADELTIDATPASDVESALFDCVRDRAATWLLHPDPAPARVAFGVLMDPVRE